MNRFLDLSAREYRADNIGENVPSLTQSIANEMLTRSPWHAHRLHPRLGGKARIATDATDAGSLLHLLLLGQEHDLAVVDADDFRTKEARAQRDAAIAAGKQVVKRSELHAAMERAARIDRVLRCEHGITLGTMRRELTAVWSEQTDTMGEVPSAVVCRARLDAFDGSTVYDLKTCQDASPGKLARSVRTYGYHVQRAAYLSAVGAIDPRMAGRHRFVIIAIENETDAVCPIELDATYDAIGRKRWQTAVNAWRQCLTSGTWPGYASGEAVRLECPEWEQSASDSECSALRGKVGI